MIRKSYDDLALFPERYAGTVADAAKRFVLNFDDLGASGTLADGYGASGLLWENFSYLNKGYAAFLYGGEERAGGYFTGVTSEGVAIHSTSDTVPATLTTGGGNFNLASFELTSAFYNGLTVEIKGYDNGVLKYDVVQTVDVAGPTFVDLGWKGIDTVTFSGEGGTLADGVAGTTHDFVIDDVKLGGKSGAVTGTVYDDANGNGLQDAGEAGLKGVTLFVDLNRNGALDDGEQSAITNRNGVYKLTNVPFGAHDIVQQTPDGYVQTSPADPFATYKVNDAAKFDWVEISETGKELIYQNGDDGAAIVDFGKIKLFGETFTSGFVTTNGIITFDRENPASNQPQQLPDPNTPNAVIAPFWADLNPSASNGHAYVLNDTANHRTIIEFQNFALYSDVTKIQTFEVIIDKKGTITFLYQHMDDLGQSASIGLENSDGTTGLQYSFFENSLHDGMALRYTPTVDPIPGAAHVSVDAGKTLTGVNFGDQLAAGGVGPAAFAHGAEAGPLLAQAAMHLADLPFAAAHVALA
jgi:hypothetical protein